MLDSVCALGNWSRFSGSQCSRHSARLNAVTRHGGKATLSHSLRAHTGTAARTELLEHFHTHTSASGRSSSTCDAKMHSQVESSVSVFACACECFCCTCNGRLRSKRFRSVIGYIWHSELERIYKQFLSCCRIADRYLPVVCRRSASRILFAQIFIQPSAPHLVYHSHDFVPHRFDLKLDAYFLFGSEKHLRNEPIRVNEMRKFKAFL